MKHPDFEHNEDEHTYHWQGILQISITDVLSAQGFTDYAMIPDGDREFYLLRGRAVHKATQLFDEGILDWSSLVEEVDWRGERRPWTLGYVKAYDRMKVELKVEPIVIEEPLFDQIYRFAGRPDRFSKTTVGHLVMQIKTGGVEDWVGLQTAGEERLLRACNLIEQERIKRWGVELKPDGTYKLRYFESPVDIKIFLSALAVEKWKETWKCERKKGEGNGSKQNPDR